jgi:hypothetical protein
MAFSAVSGSRGTDHLKKYWWIMVGAVVLIGAWLSTSTMPSTGGDEIAHGPSTEQSLFALDSTENPSGAPGGLAAAARAAADEGDGDGDGAGYSKDRKSTQQSSLWTAPKGSRQPGAAAGAPLSEELSKELEDAAKDGPNSTKYAEAIAKVASGTKAPDNSWGNKSARSGFKKDWKKPKLNAGKVGLSRSGGGGSTRASLKIDKAFGLGGKVKADLGPGRFSPGKAGSGGKIARNAVKNNKSLQGLKGAKKRSLDSLKGADEMAAGGGRQTFDASGAKGATALAQLRNTGAAGLNAGAGTPTNLKGTDSAGINQKKIEVPDVDGEEAKDDGSEASKKYMQQQMMMMIAMMAISGIMGPTFSGMGTALATSLNLGAAGPSNPGTGITTGSIPK